MEQRLLIVEDDRLIAEAASDYFTGKGWEVTIRENGGEALELFQRETFQILLLDVMMPEMDGFALCREIRKSSNLPVIFITARVLEEDVLNGYSLGADDYVTKPFSLPILYAKVMALTNRVRNRVDFLQAGSLKIDTAGHKVYKQGQCLYLPPKEYEMLRFFLENPGRIYSRQQLLIRFWGYDFDGNERVVDNHVKKLRKAIGDCGCRIQTVHKIGYRMEIEGEEG